MIKEQTDSTQYQLEKFSSAFTLSDMEIFIFPDLLYPLVLANIMSPITWEWRKNEWFKDIDKKSFTWKANRIKQFIMDNYTFNLDLETWGLTTKQKEVDRFNNFIDIDILSKSNALFGYEGDKYYFDLDIRKHFGLDKYTTDTIPYWKTETIEAMTAFKYKEGYATGAGECVSLSALYAAALFVVGGIPLEKIFLIATPLHSQNFITENEGLLTNNRRIVTKNMWCNGTALSTKARRALEHERITIVSHISGFIHTAYNTANIDTVYYQTFTNFLTSYLKTEISPEIFVNFLRFDSNYKQCFQYTIIHNGKPRYINLEKIFSYEHTSRNNFSGPSRSALLAEIDMEECDLQPIEGRISLNEVEDYLKTHKQLSFTEIKNHFLQRATETGCRNTENLIQLFNGLAKFIEVIPQLPDTDKTYQASYSVSINSSQTRNEIVRTIENEAGNSALAMLSLYVYRNMDLIPWEPFLKAALERNPVSIQALNLLSVNEAFNLISNLENYSIYPENRLALPDEVWNFKRGDGVEKALLFINYLKNVCKIDNVELLINGQNVTVSYLLNNYSFKSEKNFNKQFEI